MKTWKSNLEETKQRYINWWNHKGIILNICGSTSRKECNHMQR